MFEIAIDEETERSRDTERHETHVNQCEMSSSFSATSPSTSSAYQLEEHISAPRATPELPPSDPKRRKWQSHPGRNRFGCGGRLVCSRSHGAFVVTVILMIATLTVYFVFDAPFLWGYSPAIPIVAAVLSLIVITNFFATSFTDPGILPRVDNIEIIEMDRQQANGNGINDVAHLRPRFQDVVVNGEHVKMKYCTTCRLYRPPRCSHCAICDNCVLMFDHHCPWVGNCIGLRNYTYFYRFVFCLSILVIYLFASAVTHISLLAQEMPFGDVMRKTPGSAVVIVICFFTTWSIIGLACFHTYLLCADLTTNEDLKGLYRRKHRPTPPSSTPSTSAATNSSVGHSTKNPFYAGCFKSFFGRLFKSRFPSLLDARGYLDPHPTIEIRVPKKSEKSIENH